MLSRSLFRGCWQKPEIVGLSPAGGEQFPVSRTFPGQRFDISGQALHPTQAIQLRTWHVGKLVLDDNTT